MKRPRTIAFTKMSGSGNDFVVLDNRTGLVSGDLSEFARRVCARRVGVGADGLILLEKDADSDFLMRYYNADGSEASMCGNGGRCAALFAYSRGIAGSNMRFRTEDGFHSASVEHGRVSLSMRDPHGLDLDRRLELGDGELTAAFIHAGVPHVVLAVDDVDAVDVLGLGRKIRHLPAFRPDGTNADFAQLLGNGRIKVRTYERGVEDETLSCGTGCVAAALVMSRRHGLPSPVTCLTRGGESLRVLFRQKGEVATDVLLEGGATVTYEGKLRPAEFSLGGTG